MEKTDRIVYVDMDGVLTDFNLGFENMFGMRPEEYTQVHGKRANYEAVYATGTEFWESLPLANGAMELWSFLNENFLNVKILTSAGIRDVEKKRMLFQTVRQGKLNWIATHLRNIADDDVITVPIKRLKAQYAKDGDVLIDDTEANVADWGMAGGIGILHRARQYQKTIDILKELV